MSQKPPIVVASRNPGKVREIRALLADLPVEVESLLDHPEVPAIAETGVTFTENSIQKACAVAEATGRLALADDSGLEVDALDGAPGVYSARFAGPNATDSERNARLLELLAEIPAERRTARYVAAITIASPEGEVRSTVATCEGVITDEPRGTNGFGYDPLFLVPELGRTMAELSPEEKNRISHRGRALRQARELLLSMLPDATPDLG
jgi:XTP/dITP diphosphohydrolase